MHPQLEILLELQDLKEQRRALAAGQDEEHREVEREEFNIDAEEAVEHLDSAIEGLLDELKPAIRSRYERIAAGRSRAVVPVINGTCYGCFVSIPTAVASDQDRHDEVRHCDNCGRFVYILGV